MAKVINRFRSTNRAARILWGFIGLVLAGAVVAVALGSSRPAATNRAGSLQKDAASAGEGNASAVAPDVTGEVVPESGAPAPVARQYAVSGSATSGGGVADSVKGGSVPPVPGSGGGLVPNPGAHVVRTATINVEVKRHRGGSAFDRVMALASELGGYVASSNRSNGDTAGGNIEIRVPVARFDEARRALGAVGKIRNEELRGQDVGDQIVDIEARLRSLQSEEATLRTLVTQAKTVGEVLQVQPQLFDVRRQIEQLQAQRTQLDQQASYSTLSVSVFETGAAVKADPKPQPVLVRSTSTAWHAGLSVVGGMLIVLGVSVPFALIGLGIWVVVRSRRRTVTAIESAV